MNIHLVVGTRPNFMKVAPIIRRLEERKYIDYKLVHTGQHYDVNMSGVFIEKLGIPIPDVNFGMHSTSYASIGRMQSLYADYVDLYNPDVVLVVGDVDSTRAIAEVVWRMGCDRDIKLVHVEAGLRSGEHIPEEMNRKITDMLSDVLFCTIDVACENLRSEGIEDNKIYNVGDTMIDQLYHSLSYAEADPEPPQELYILVTLHRQYNVDDPGKLKSILGVLRDLTFDNRVVFPIHPRTMRVIKSYGLESYLDNIQVLEPLGYLEMLAYMKDAAIVITDSGGVQVETSVLGVPCVTVRPSTERVHTIRYGTNTLVSAVEDIESTVNIKLADPVSGVSGLKDDGRASERIIKILEKNYGEIS